MLVLPGLWIVRIVEAPKPVVVASKDPVKPPVETPPVVDPVKPPVELPGTYHVYHQYVVRAPRRDALRDHLQKNGVGCNIYYPKSLHLQACFADLGYKAGQFPHTEKACNEVLALPIFPELSDAQIERVADTMLAFFA